MVASLWELGMNFRAVNPVVLLAVLSACGKLTPEEKKSVTPDIVFQELRSYVSRDEESGTWSSSSYFYKRLEGVSGDSVALAAGESITVNGSAMHETKSDSTVNYWLSGSVEPAKPLLYVWTVKGGKTYSNECGWHWFDSDPLPTSISKSAGLQLSVRVEAIPGFFSASLYPAASTTASSASSSPSVSATVTHSEGDTVGTVAFPSSALAPLPLGEATLTLFWNETPELTEATAKGGRCSSSFNRYRKVTIVE
jgi:hypothetical protein